MSTSSTRVRTGEFRIRPRVRVAGRPAFQVFGALGALLAAASSVAMAVHAGLSLRVMGAIATAAIAAFLILAMASKILFGQERLTYYHHEIAVTAAAALVIQALRQPVLPYLDITILGIGMFLVFGRVGCFMVGCCHGRPWHWGVHYGREHTREGFPSYLAGVRLFPVQALESIFVFAVVMVGVTLVWRHQPTGSALAWYTISYGLGRFSCEFFRGDAARPYWGGFSEAQWCSVLLMTVTVGAEFSGRLAFHAWHVVVALALPFVMLLVALWRRGDETRKFQILHPHHVSEVAGAIESLRANGRPSASVRIARTSIGLQISAGNIGDEVAALTHFTISRRGAGISRKAALIVADLILQLRRESRRGELIAGGKGVFHLVVRAAGSGVAP
jgi:prolipoprotein diacylglyceryltransferase